jgi:hypothetical protein
MFFFRLLPVRVPRFWLDIKNSDGDGTQSLLFLSPRALSPRVRDISLKLFSSVYDLETFHLHPYALFVNTSIILTPLALPVPVAALRTRISRSIIGLHWTALARTAIATISVGFPCRQKEGPFRVSTSD